MTQSVFFFGEGRAEGTREWKDLLGGKGANLAEMTNIGIPVPPGFTIACPMCDVYLRDGKVPDSLRAEVERDLKRLEAASGRGFGDVANPLLVSVRSGARVSMPGMMQTILNLGLNDQTVEGLARLSSNPRFAWDSYRRFLQMYGEVVLNASHHHFEALLAAKRMVSDVKTDSEVPVELLQALVVEYKALIRSTTGHPFPMDPREQLWGAIEAVWRSWMIRRAVDYRRHNNIPETPGTAVNIVAMVFGNLGPDSGTGVAFTRDPATGEKRFYGEFLVNAQGEDVVAGIRTPLPISQMPAAFPAAHAQLLSVAESLERHFRDMQDLEFTVERGKLYLLQTRNGKRTVGAAVRVARDMVAEGLISQPEAVHRVQPNQLDQLLHPVIDTGRGDVPFATGLPASPGAASGIAVFDADAAEARAKQGEKVILIRDETTPDDFHGIIAARAVLTARGGMTSHAAVVARGMGKCAVVGCTALRVDANHRVVTVGDVSVHEGEWLTVDGASGHVYVGDLPTLPSEVMRVLLGELTPESAPVYQAYSQILAWADGSRRLKVRANAETPHDARQARRFGAEGIGLCRTEHMFFEVDITHLAISLMKHRLRSAFGDDAKFKVIGEPTDQAGAAQLAADDPYQFQFWALGLVGARPAEEKKGSDKGIDGRIYFHDEGSTGTTKQIILSVKGGKTSSPHVRDLLGVLDREKAQVGVLITLQEPTRDMKTEAVKAGFYESPWGKHPKCQILTIAELLRGDRIDAPPIGRWAGDATLKAAPKAKRTGPENAGLFGDQAQPTKRRK